jgi:hypothetical protein
VDLMENAGTMYDCKMRPHTGFLGVPGWNSDPRSVTTGVLLVLR